MASDKLREIEDASALIMNVCQSLIPVSSGTIISAMRQAMDAKQLQIFDLAHFCEQETIRAQQAGAHFAACLMSAAMNEALLTLMCLKYESEVIATSQYAYSTKKKKQSLSEVLEYWKFEQLINVAAERNWIPASIVDNDITTALADGYREVAPIVNPGISDEHIEVGVKTFLNHPGLAMLRTSQNLRNSVHANKWLRSKNAFNQEHFAKWCHFATILGGEIRLCLMQQITKRDSAIALAQFHDLSQKLSTLPPEWQQLAQQAMAEYFNKAKP